MIGHRFGIIRGTAQGGANVEKVTLARNVTWNWAGIIFSGVISFITLPVMIHHLGSFYYGMWVLLNSFAGYYGLLDLGITTSLRRFTSRLSGANDSGALRQIFAAALYLSAAAAVVIVATTAIIAYFLPDIVTIPAGSVRPVRILFFLVGASVAVAFPVRTLGAYLQGMQRFDLFNLGNICSAVLRGGCIVAALWSGQGVIAVAGITLAVTLFSLAFFYAAAHRLDCKLLRRFGVFSWTRMRELVTFSSFVFVQSIGDYFRFQLDSFVIARYLAVALVTPFSVAASLMNYFMSVMFSLSTPLMSVAGQLDGAQKYGESRRFFLGATKLTATIATLGGMLLICNGKTLLAIWLGKDLVDAYPVLVALTLAYVSDLGQVPSLNLLRSRGRHQLMAYWTVVEGVANLALSIYLAPRYGILGVAIGTLIPMLATKLIVQPWYTLKVVEISGAEYVATVARPLMAGLACVAIYEWMAKPPNQLWALCLSIMWQTLLFALLASLLVLTADQRRSLLVRFTKVRRPLHADV